MSTQDNLIHQGDSVRIRSGRHAGQNGIATNVTWHSNQYGAYARVRVKFDGGEIDDYTMGNLEKVKESLAARAMPNNSI